MKQNKNDVSPKEIFELQKRGKMSELSKKSSKQTCRQYS